MKKRRAYTLIEVLASLAILAIIATSVLASFYNSVQLSDKAKDQTKLAFHGQGMVEAFKARELGASDVNYPLPDYVEDKSTIVEDDGGKIYKLRLEVGEHYYETEIFIGK